VTATSRLVRQWRWWLASAVVVVAVSAGLASMSDRVGSGGEAAATSSSPVTTSISTTSTLVETTTSDGPGVGVLALIDRLRVAQEPPRRGYERRLFPHWHDVNGTGCTARHDVLAAQAIGFVQVDLVNPCFIVEGDWYSVYDGVLHRGAPGDVDVDHVVALAEAWDSGAWAWDQPMRRQFANDPINLLVVTASSNRTKGDRDVGEWRPPRRDAWCLTATITVQVKFRYELSVDAAEAQALRAMLATCSDTTMPTPAASAATSSTVVATTCVDLNTASLDELQRLRHIGEGRARQIVDLRPLSSVNDLVRVRGIATGRLADIVAQGLVCP
jgi:DNA uptake protein ComE-like DNA-binding protein